MPKFFAFLLLLLLQSSVFSMDSIVQVIGGGHPKNNLAIRYGINSPTISDQYVFKENIQYVPFYHPEKSVEDNVRSLFTDGRRKVSKNGYSAVEISAKYDGNCGIDGLFLVKKRAKEFLVAVESKYNDHSFGPGIQHESGIMAQQMSTEWIRIVSDTLCERAKTNGSNNLDLYKYMKKNPASLVRAFAEGDGDGLFKIWLLEGYGDGCDYIKRDQKLLTKMFK